MDTFQYTNKPFYIVATNNSEILNVRKNAVPNNSGLSSQMVLSHDTQYDLNPPRFIFAYDVLPYWNILLGGEDRARIDWRQETQTCIWPLGELETVPGNVANLLSQFSESFLTQLTNFPIRECTFVESFSPSHFRIQIPSNWEIRDFFRR